MGLGLQAGLFFGFRIFRSVAFVLHLLGFTLLRCVPFIFQRKCYRAFPLLPAVFDRNWSWNGRRLEILKTARFPQTTMIF